MSDSKRSVLITGANGFIGSRLCRQFLSEGFEVIAGVRQNCDLSLIADLDIKKRYGDILDTDSLPEMVYGVDYIVHNAGVVKANRPETYFAVNERGTKNILESVVRNNPKVRKFVLISSLAAAGPAASGTPKDESDELNPVTNYGRSKAAGENVALSFADKLNVVAVRPPGVYGPGDKEMFAIFQTINSRFKPLIGRTGRKLQVVHVDDLCRGIFAATTKASASGRVYFIAEKKSYTLKQFMNIIAKASGRSTIPVHIPSSLFRLIAAASETIFRIVGATPMLTVEKAGELLGSWEVSTERAKNELGFESKISLEQGALETFAWYREKGWL